MSATLQHFNDLDVACKKVYFLVHGRRRNVKNGCTESKSTHMATRDDIAALTAFCECERKLAAVNAARAEALRPITEERDATMQRIMDAMNRAQVKCLELPDNLVPGARYVRVVELRSQRDITPTLVTHALTNAMADIDAQLEKVTREDDAQLEDTLELAMLHSVKEARTTTRPTISFTNNRPRGVDPETIPSSQSDSFKTYVKKLDDARAQYARQVAEFKSRREALSTQRESVLQTVRTYMERMERDTQPVVLSGGATGQDVNDTAILKRKIVSTKTPLTVDQLKLALRTALQETRDAHGFSRYTLELWRKHRDTVLARVAQLADELRVVDRSEEYALQRKRGRRAAR